MILPPSYIFVSEASGAPVHIMCGWGSLCETAPLDKPLQHVTRTEPMCESCMRELAMRIMEDRLHKPDLCATLGHDWQGDVCLRCGYDVS